MYKSSNSKFNYAKVASIKWEKRTMEKKQTNHVQIHLFKVQEVE